MRGKPAPGSRSPPRTTARRSAAIYRGSDRPRKHPAPPSCPMLPDVVAYHRRDKSARAKPGINKAPWTIRQDHPGGKAPATGTPAMQPNTANNHHDTTPPVPPELLEAVARALAAALIPPPRRPPPPETETEEPADFLTAAQLARRLGISRETVRRLAIAGTLPHTVVCHGH